jgi:hypothetical protein
VDSEVAPTEPGKPAAADASQPLIGTLEDYSPAGVLQVLSSQGETGAVRFNGEGGCTVYLHEGQLYFAETTNTGEALAIALVRPGRLSPDDWDNATAAGYPTQEVGQELINTGTIDRELLASVVLSVIYDPLISLFRQGEGDFEFEPGTVHWMGPFRTFAVDAIVSEVRRRVREADEMAPLIPTLDVWVESARSLPSDRGTVNLRRDDWEIVVAAAGGRSLPDLAIELGRGVWSTARLVYRLASVHLLEVTAVPAEGYLDEGDAAAEPATSGLGAATTAFADTPGFLGEADVETDEPPAGTGFADPAPVSPGGFLPAPDEADEAEALDTDDTDEIQDAEVVDDPADPADPAEDIVDLSSPIAAGEGPPALLDWDTPSTDAAPAAEGDTWGETAWDDQPWDAPSSTPEGGPSWDAPPPPAAPDAEQAWADEGSWQNSSWDQPAAEGATDEAGDDATVVGLGAARLGVAGPGTDAPDTGDAPDAPDAAAAAAAASGDHGITFDAPTLHPDIAKALAESTYADSATAINAMAARLGAGADDDTDEVDEPWDAAPVAQTAPEGTGDEFEQFWAGDGEERAFPWETEPQGAEPDDWAASSAESEDIGLTWQPTSWDTGVETAPLPQRDRVRPEGEDDHGPIGAADPEWLENLYSQFMANGEAPAGKRRGSKEANPVESVFAADPATLPKTKPLRRVIDAIRRL